MCCRTSYGKRASSLPRPSPEIFLPPILRMLRLTSCMPIRSCIILRTSISSAGRFSESSSRAEFRFQWTRSRPIPWSLRYVCCTGPFRPTRTGSGHLDSRTSGQSENTLRLRTYRATGGLSRPAIPIAAIPILGRLAIPLARFGAATDRKYATRLGPYLYAICWLVGLKLRRPE